jgi:4-methylaminobutanoate oxidase (formaldehyde-forming)
VGQTILRGYLDKAHWAQTEFQLEVFGERHAIKRVEGPLYDPQNTRLKGGN